MKREIKFRAWHDSTKEMYKDVHTKSSFYELFDNSLYELMQYTGLKDKNGREIYEGDILDNHYRVEWNQLHCGWALYNHKGYCHELLADEYYLIGETLPPWQISAEVIGNIYENSELLKA